VRRVEEQAAEDRVAPLGGDADLHVAGDGPYQVLPWWNDAMSGSSHPPLGLTSRTAHYITALMHHQSLHSPTPYLHEESPSLCDGTAVEAGARASLSAEEAAR